MTEHGLSWLRDFLIDYMQLHAYSGDDMARILDEAAAGNATAQVVDEVMTALSVSWRQSRQSMLPAARQRLREWVMEQGGNEQQTHRR